jgi:hypothetical protein
MTKLFSMKSLACAGAAAFALTLAAVPAPQASAAANTASLSGTVDYSAGTLTLEGLTDYTQTSDGATFLYYGVASGKDATVNKLSSIDASQDDSKVVLDISNILGKEKTIKVAADAEGKTGVVTKNLAAAPTLKVSYDSANANTLSKFEVDGTDVTSNIAQYSLQYRTGNYGAWKSVVSDDNASTIKSAIENAQKLGTTVYIRIASGTTSATAATLTSPYSKEAKLKISGQAKAPKISIKTAALTKAFSWKIGDKSEYQIITGTLADGKLASSWTSGKADKVGWATIFTDASVANAATVAVGDAVASDFTIFVRTAATTSKAASNVAYQSILASADSPKQTDVAVKPVTGKGKTPAASAASISAKATKMTIGTEGSKNTSGSTEDVAAAIQYSLDGEKWVTLKKDTQIEYDKTTNGKIYFRFVASDKKKNPSVLPSAITTVEIPKDGTDTAVSGQTISKSSGAWADDKAISDWNATS